MTSKLVKLQKKITETVLHNEKRMLQQHSKGSTTLLSDRDKEIIKRSMLGTFHERFNVKDFEVQFSKIRSVFSDSKILHGVQPYLLYFNLPKNIIQHMQRPERLVLRHQSTQSMSTEE